MGNATQGSGGGVAVQETYSTSQCTNGNHVSFRKAKFVALWGCIGTVLHIDESEFYNNTTPLDGGHVVLQLLSLDYILLIVLNNSHFESGKAEIGGGIAAHVFATVGGRCTSASMQYCA